MPVAIVVMIGCECQIMGLMSISWETPITELPMRVRKEMLSFRVERRSKLLLRNVKHGIPRAIGEWSPVKLRTGRLQLFSGPRDKALWMDGEDG